MTLQDLGSIGEFVGAVAVVVSLIYLAVQIRQNTHQLEHNAEVLRANAELDSARLSTDWNAQVAGDAELTEIWGAGLNDPSKLDATSVARMGMLLGSLFYRLEGLYRLHRRGFLPEESWLPWEQLMRNVLSTPLARAWWEGEMHPFSETFRQRVRELAEMGPDPTSRAGGVQR
jgi:hypothetical protein